MLAAQYKAGLKRRSTIANAKALPVSKSRLSQPINAEGEPRVFIEGTDRFLIEEPVPPAVKAGVRCKALKTYERESGF